MTQIAMVNQLLITVILLYLTNVKQEIKTMSNKKRENIIGCILNNGIPNEYYDDNMCMEQNGKK